jgi:hypothetical protein
MTKLEEEVAELRAMVVDLSKRARVDAVAEAFLRGERVVREGDYFLLGEDRPTRLMSVSEFGKWTYFDGRNTVEPHRVPRPDEYERLYTRVEVADIAAKIADQANVARGETAERLDAALTKIGELEAKIATGWGEAWPVGTFANEHAEAIARRVAAVRSLWSHPAMVEMGRDYPRCSRGEALVREMRSRVADLDAAMARVVALKEELSRASVLELETVTFDGDD